MLGGLAFSVFLSPKVPSGQPIHPDLDHFQHPPGLHCQWCIVIRELERQRQRQSVAPCSTIGLQSYILLPLLSSKPSWPRQLPLSIKHTQDNNSITHHHAAVIRRYSIVHTSCLGLGKIVRLSRYVTTLLDCLLLTALLLVPFSPCEPHLSHAWFCRVIARNAYGSFFCSASIIPGTGRRTCSPHPYNTCFHLTYSSLIYLTFPRTSLYSISLHPTHC